MPIIKHVLVLIFFIIPVLPVQCEDMNMSLPLQVSATGSGMSGSSIHDLVTISYPTQERDNQFHVKTETTPSQLERFIISKPGKCWQGEINIWREKNDVWIILASPKMKATITGTIQAESDFKIIENKIIKVTYKGNHSLVFDYNGAIYNTEGILKFESGSSLITFTLLVDGEYNPSKIHLGHDCINPIKIPFTIESEIAAEQSEHINKSMKSSSSQPATHHDATSYDSAPFEPHINQRHGGSFSGPGGHKNE